MKHVVITAAQLAEMLGQHPDTITRKARTGAYPGRIHGSNPMLFKKAPILKFLGCTEADIPPRKGASK